jgi:hypothetical protein
MPPSDSIRERIILDKLKPQLETIQAGATYWHSMAAGAVQRFEQQGNKYDFDSLIIIHEGDDEVALEGPMPCTSRRFDVELECVTRHDPADVTNSEKLANRLRQDVETALMKEPFWALDLADRCTPPRLSPLFTEVGQPSLTFIARFTVHYRHNRSNPAALI